MWGVREHINRLTSSTLLSPALWQAQLRRPYIEIVLQTHCSHQLISLLYRVQRECRLDSSIHTVLHAASRVQEPRKLPSSIPNPISNPNAHIYYLVGREHRRGCRDSFRHAYSITYSCDNSPYYIPRAYYVHTSSPYVRNVYRTNRVQLTVLWETQLDALST